METETEYMSLPKGRLLKALAYAHLAGVCAGGAIGFYLGMWLT